MLAFILAGGFATRLWPLTEKRAKPLLPLAGKPLLTHLVEKIPEGMPVTVSTNQVFSNAMKEWQKGIMNQELRIKIEDAGHEDEKLGALGALAKWIEEEHVKDDVLLLAGDNYIGFSIAKFLEAYQGNALIALHDIGNLEKAKKFGTVVAHGTTVAAFEEKPENPRSTLVSTGCCILPASTLHTLVTFAQEHPDNIGGIFEHFLRKGIAVECIAFPEPWFDIGSFEAYLEATKTLVGENVIHAGRGVARYTPTEESLQGSIVIGDRSIIHKSTLRNVVLFEDCNIEDCILENCILDNHCTLKGVDLTGKMLREGTKLVR
ncbi:MAG: NDP-sugar synthase [Patescibacteria group bacterium]